MYRVPASRTDYRQIVLHILLKWTLIISMMTNVIIWGWLFTLHEYWTLLYGPLSLAQVIDLISRIIQVTIAILVLVELVVNWIPFTALGAAWLQRKRSRWFLASLIFSILVVNNYTFFFYSLQPLYFLMAFCLYLISERWTDNFRWTSIQDAKILTLPTATNPDLFQGFFVPILRIILNLSLGFFSYLWIIHGWRLSSYTTIDIVPLLIACSVGSVLGDAVGFGLKVKSHQESSRRISKGFFVGITSSSICYYYSNLSYYFSHGSTLNDWIIFGFIMFSGSVLAEPVFYTKYTIRLVKRASQISDSKFVRGVAWFLGSIVFALAAAIVLQFIKAVFIETPTSPQEFDALWKSSLEMGFVFFVVLFIINILVISRSDITKDEPLHDMEYHHRICGYLQQSDSEFLGTYARSGYPSCVAFTRKNTMNAIERAFPWVFVAGILFLFFGIFCYVLGLFLIIIYATSNLLWAGLSIFGLFSLSLGWDVISSGSTHFFKMHNDWKDFWISYWNLVAAKIEGREFNCFDECITEFEAYEEIRKWWGEKLNWRILWGVYWNESDELPEELQIRCLQEYLLNQSEDHRPLNWWDEAIDLAPFWWMYRSTILNRLQNPRLIDFDHYEDVSWTNLIRSNWWGQKPNWDDRRYVNMVKDETTKILADLEIIEDMPKDVGNMRTYVDKLVVFQAIKQEIKLIEKQDVEIDMPYWFQRVLLRVQNIRSLSGYSIRNLFAIHSYFKLWPLVLKSPSIFEELQGLQQLDFKTKEVIIQHARRRIVEITQETGPIVPDFLKWTALIYSIAFGLMTWIIR